MCDDLKATISSLKAKGIALEPPTEERWGTLSRLTLPGGGKLGIYQPKHPIAAKR